ncbi:unnamed protein product [Choristocarpus tenellus]
MCVAVVGDSERAKSQAQRSLFELRKAGVNCVSFTARGPYPTADGIDEARAMVRRIGASSIVGIGNGGIIDTAKAASVLHGSRGSCKNFLVSPSAKVASQGERTGSRVPSMGSLPIIAVPTSVGAGAAASERCLVWHPDDELLVPLTAAEEGVPKVPSVVLVDPLLSTTLSSTQTAAMAITALSTCLDSLIVWSLGAGGRIGAEESNPLKDLGESGAASVGKGIAKALSNQNDTCARQNLALASVCAGRLSSITPTLAFQLFTRATGSLLCRHYYPEICALIFPHVVEILLDKTVRGTSATDSEAIARALAIAAKSLLEDPNARGEDLLSWVEEQQLHIPKKSLSVIDPSVTAQEIANNVDLLLTLEDSHVASMWSSGEVQSVADRIVGT